MNNKHYISYDMDNDDLKYLSEEELRIQIRFYAHLLDKRLQCLENEDINAKSDAIYNLGEKLQYRLKLYEAQFNKEKPDYIWAISVAKIYKQFKINGNQFKYPWDMNKTDKINIDIEEFDKLIMGRRSIRKFTNEKISKETLNNILKYACWAPVTCNMQTTRYVVIENEEIKKQITLSSLDGSKSACVIGVIVDYRSFQNWNFSGPFFNCAAAVQNILLAAHYFDIGSCWVAGQGVNSTDYRQLLDIKDYENILSFIFLGKYTDTPFAPARRDYKEVIEWI